MGIRDRIEAGFESWGHFVFRNAWTTIALMGLVALALASQLPKLELDTSTEGFLHEDDPTRRAYEAYREQFGRDGILLIAIRPPEVFDLAFLAKLRALHEDLEREVPHLEEVTSLINARATRGEGDELIVEDLLEDWPQDAAALAELKQRTLSNPLYRNLLISEDARFTTVAIETEIYSALGESGDALMDFDEGGDVAETGGRRHQFLTGPENSAVVAAVSEVVERYEGPDFRVYMAGEPVLVDELARALQRDMGRFVLLSVVAIAGLLWVLFRRLAGVALPLGIVGLSLASTLGLMGLTGIPLRLPTQILPSFLLAVGVGAAVHILAIFFQGLRSGKDREGAVAHALGHSGLAIAMTSLTTAGGLLSFTSAELAPVVDFGVFAPVGVMLTLVFSIVLLPALLAVIPLGPRDLTARNAERPFLDRLLLRLGDMATHHPWKVLAAWTTIVVVSIVGVARIELSHNPLQWFPEEQAIRVATETIDREFRGTMSLEVLIKTGVENGLYEPELLNRLEALRLSSESLEHRGITVGKTISVADVLKEIHQALNENRPAYYAIPQDRELVAQELLLFENSGSDDLEDVVDPQFSTARLTLRIPWVDAVRYPPFIAEVEEQFAEVLGTHAEVEMTGIITVLGRTIFAVLISMTRSYIIALCVITPLMILLIQSLRGGLLSMVPNLAPVIITLGLMGWFGFPMDGFTLLIGSIAIGLAVDDTIHFMHNFQRYYSASGDAPGAVRETLQTTGRALLFTSLVLSTGFFIYMFSSMQNLSNFGLLTGFCIIVAFLADAILAPALMVLMHRPRPQLVFVPPLNPGAVKMKVLRLLRSSIRLGAILLLACFVTSSSASAETLSAREIMQRVEDRDDGDNGTQDMEMILIDKRGNQRVRKIHVFTKDKGEDTLQLMFFLSPADVKDTGFLTYDYDGTDRDDDQWLYLPALRKTKRIASSDKSGSFMGSDFNYSDLTDRELENYDYTLMKETEVNGIKVWQIEGIPLTKEEIDETGYKKSVVFVRQDNYVVIRAVSWVDKGGKLKYFDVKQLELIDGIWVPTEMHMTTKKSGKTLHKTILRNQNVKFNQDLAEEMFSVRRLEKGL